MSNVNNREDLFGRPLKVGDEVGGQAWGYTGQVRRMIVKGFTDKKVRVAVHIPEYTSGGRTRPAFSRITHAFAHDLIKTGVNTFDD